MKDDKAVQAALQVLKENAETDFEKLSVARLEMALTNPPKVNVIDDTHQEFNGKIYRCSKNDQHYERYDFLHTAVFEYYNGTIPEGCVVHHIDINPANNNLTNLTLKTRSEHSKIHGQIPKRKKTKFICKWCGEEFEAVSNGSNMFCCMRCQKHWRYHSGLDHEYRSCVICGQQFYTRKASKAQTCSRQCAASLHLKRTKNENKTISSTKAVTSDTTIKENDCK